MNLTNNKIAAKVKSHILGYPRIGANRELKWALEDYWKGNISQAQLINEGRSIKHSNWAAQLESGLDFITVGDFAWYDQVLNMTAYLGVIPNRFNHKQGAPVDMDTYFRLARGRAPSGEDAAACDMSKWFNSNYHYIVPELNQQQSFHVNAASLLEEIKQAQSFVDDQECQVKPVILGPLSYLWLAKAQDDFDVLELLPQLLEAYGELTAQIHQQGVQWLQVDEPILVLDLPQAWKSAFERTYHQLNRSKLRILLATYFSGLGENLTLASQLPCDGLHVDLVAGQDDIDQILDRLPSYKILSLGVVNGRNIWRTDIQSWHARLQKALNKLPNELWVATSCSLLHCPVDLNSEQKWLSSNKEKSLNTYSFARQKLDELNELKALLNSEATDLNSFARKPSSSNAIVDWNAITLDRAEPFSIRQQKQAHKYRLPLYPTTTIGSFPQTPEIRQARKAYKQGVLNQGDYEHQMQQEIKHVIDVQEALDIDVLVHGEAERNDMVEYFGEQLEGYAFSENGWVQSYGSRCVKPPIIAGDISRPSALTVKWSQFAQSLTTRPVKGMLTGPITMLLWSFPREDISLEQQSLQLAYALKQEVEELQQAGIGIIQVDEPALREGLPLKQNQRAAYLNWAVNSFKLAVSSALSDTQIHTHMCYSEFNDIISSIAQMDADVITIETSRSNMELLTAFESFEYPNEIGPGVYDIHSPVVPKEKWMLALLERASERIDAKKLWVNPDCGLKTRGWPETKQALSIMVSVAKQLREKHGTQLKIPAELNA